jgi:SAM-dependent methyltransferase
VLTWLTKLAHRLVARPIIYDIVQRLVGAGKIRRRLQIYVEALGDHGEVLDIGGGTGLYRDVWPTGWHYINLDNDPQKLRGFRRRSSGDTALLGDAAAVPLPDMSLDAVICTFVSHHLPDATLTAFVRESARVLRPNGTLIFIDPIWQPNRIVSRLLWAFDRGSHPRTRDRLVAAMSDHFDITRVEEFAILHEYLLCSGRPRPRTAEHEIAAAALAEAPAFIPSLAAVSTPRLTEAGAKGTTSDPPATTKRLLIVRNALRWIPRLHANRPVRTADCNPSVAAHHDSQLTYDPSYFAHLVAIEDRHFWFRTRNRIVSTLIRQITREAPRGFRVLEVGCGTGTVLHSLEKACPTGQVVGMDLFAESLYFARQRTSCPLVQGDALAPPFGAEFDVVGLFDVLEHLPNDAGVLRAMRNLLVPGGTLMLTVPANESLWSYFDDASHHCRRYEEDQLTAMVADAGFRIEYVTPFMALLLPVLWTTRRLSWLRHHKRHDDPSLADEMAMRDLRVVPLVNEVVLFLLQVEAWLLARRSHLPFGTSLLVVARVDDGKPQLA